MIRNTVYIKGKFIFTGNVLKKRQNRAAELRKKINQAPSMPEKDRAALRADIKVRRIKRKFCFSNVFGTFDILWSLEIGRELLQVSSGLFLASTGPSCYFCP